MMLERGATTRARPAAGPQAGGAAGLDEELLELLLLIWRWVRALF